MKSPAATETMIKGSWTSEKGRVVPDQVCMRISDLVESHFVKLAISSEFGAWETLYVDPIDGRYWELTYLESDTHGGGPPQISVIGENVARSKYDF